MGVVGIEDGAWCARGWRQRRLGVRCRCHLGVVQGAEARIRLGSTDEEMTVLRESVCVCVSVMPLRACSWLGAERERERERERDVIRKQSCRRAKRTEDVHVVQRIRLGSTDETEMREM